MKSLMSVLVCVGFVVGMAAPVAAGSEHRSDRANFVLSLKDTPRPSTPTPEPSSALVFGAGLLIASQISRKRRR